jgi:hypothetical protein
MIMKKIIVSMALSMSMALGTTLAWAQKIDHEKMQRDIQVAETVLASLVRGNSHQWVSVRGSQNSSRYLEGYGVILQLPPVGFFSAGFSMHPAKVIINRRFESEEFSNEDDVIQEESEEERQEDNSDDFFYQDENVLKENVESEEELLDVIKTFLLDYGDLIGQLNENEKIMVMQGRSPFHVLIASDSFNYSTQKKSQLSAEIRKGDLMDFRSGKISREEALDKIKITSPEVENPVEQDLELLASIFDRLYRPDLSKTYFIAGKVEYDYIPDFGVIYKMNLGSSPWTGAVRIFGSRAPKIERDQEKSDQEIREVYPQFEKEFLENILDYGRTLKSLLEEEHLVFHVNLGECPGCGIPEYLEVTIKSAALMEYGEGEIGRDEALEKMSIKKGPLQ